MIPPIALEDTDSPLQHGAALRLATAIVGGIAMRFVLGLHPVAWLAWIVPAGLLLLALKTGEREARWLLLLAMGLGCSVNFSYYQTVMGVSLAALMTLALTLLWRWVFLATRRIVLRYQTGWAVFVYPVLWVAIDTLMAAILPDGNWASLAYSQSEVLPVMQLASLFGVGGVLFIVALVPSTLAVGAFLGRRSCHGAAAYALTLVLGAATWSFGTARLQQPLGGSQTTFGMAAIDDAIGLQAQPAYIESILHHYEEHVAELAAQGARIVVLPEKVGVVRPARAAEWRDRFGALALRNQVWLEVGVTQDDGNSIVNLAWLFEPSGKLSANYQKHYLAPPERSYAKGTTFETRTIEGRTYGLAICKDMHFATMSRAYAARGASVMLVPAWDFGMDAWMGARMTAARGIEGGFGIVRSSREGLMTVSDPYGRVVAESPSAGLPGRTLLVTTPVAAPQLSLYARTGDLLGWICVALSVWLLVISRRRPQVATSTDPGV